MTKTVLSQALISSHVCPHVPPGRSTYFNIFIAIVARILPQTRGLEYNIKRKKAIIIVLLIRLITLIYLYQ
jgi:hypothetical protein